MRREIADQSIHGIHVVWLHSLSICDEKPCIGVLNKQQGSCNMISMKRVIVAVLAGVVFGYGDVWIGELIGLPLDRHVTSAFILNTMLTGFIIGISSIRIHYIPHGMLIGFAGALPIALPALSTGIGAMALLLGLGIVWGICIELIATKVFVAPAPSLYRAPGR